MSQKKRVCVFCGSRVGKNPVFAKQAKKLGRMLASNNIGLVFGGGSVGLMNEVANAALNHGGQAHGVIPEHLNDREVAHENLTALHITDTMHERKAMMAELADAFIALPGGFGTFEELLEIITWSQLRLHDKPVIVFNIDGYYDQLIAFFDKAVNTGFVDDKNRNLLKVGTNVEECLNYLPFLIVD
jgi:uncharacterized protein (TIGR00730 family)